MPVVCAGPLPGRNASGAAIANTLTMMMPLATCAADVDGP